MWQQLGIVLLVLMLSGLLVLATLIFIIKQLEQKLWSGICLQYKVHMSHLLRKDLCELEEMSCFTN